MAKERKRSSAADYSDKFAVVAKCLFLLLGSAGIGAAVVYSYHAYQDSIDPKHIYGRWIEVGTSSQSRNSIEFNQTGFLRNHRLTSTQFEFNGSEVQVTTGSGNYVYQLAYINEIPRLRRIKPSSPALHFVKQGYEDQIDMEGGGIANKRRSAISNHFSEK
ncbi:DUF2850 domain-containing protein [Vibrio ponticus]|uniref:DUF2850 domain-containing protein n=1 Tax=Vibrio ponticus TaxID=265668 RepID=UPI0009F9EBA7|nr:DUF2850 domain-containing protein [Vibrio ponticus]